MKAFYIKPHNDPNEFIIFGDDSLTADQAHRKAWKESATIMRRQFPHTIQEIKTIPDGDWKAHFIGNGSGMRTVDIEGLTIPEAIKKAKQQNFIGPKATIEFFDRPALWKETLTHNQNLSKTESR